MPPVPLPGPAGTGVGGPRGPVPGFVASRSVVATKTDTPILETAQSISVIGRQQIEDQNPTSINQAMRYTPAVVTESRGGSGATRLEQFKIRGFDAPVFLDGLRMPGSRDANPTIDPFRLERIDIVKGPSSTLYGQSGPGGLVNLTSKVPQFVNHGELFVQGGSRENVRTGFDVGGAIPNGQPGTEQFAYRMIGFGWKGEGPAETTKVERQFIAPSFTWRPSNETSLTIMGFYQKDPFSGHYGALPALGTVFKRDFGNGVLGRFARDFYDGDRSYEKSNRTQASIGYIFDHSFSENLRFHSAGRYMHTDGSYKSTYSSYDNGPYDQGPLMRRGHGGTDVDIQAFSIDNYLEGKFDTGPFQHTAIVGVDHYYQDTRTLASPFPNAPPLNILAPNYFMGIPGPAYTSRGVVHGEQTGVYIQDQIKFGGFNLTLGGRYDKARQWGPTYQVATGAATRQDSSSNAFTGKASLLYLFENGLAPYVAYTEAFEPLASGKIYDPAFGSTGRIPDPVRSAQWEGGVKYQPPGTDILLTAAAFDIKRQNALVADPVNPGFSLQSGEITVQGVELEARAKLTSGLSVVGGLSFLDARNSRETATTPNQVTNRQVPLQDLRPTMIPDKTASLFLEYKFQDGPLLGLTIGGGVRHLGPSWGDPANTFKVPASTVADAMMRYEFKYVAPSLKGLDMQVNVQNVLDERYVSGCFNYGWCYYGQGRTVYATLRYRW